VSIVEVFALCGFVFGVACRLPPSLTILLLNGCFCFPIGCYLIHRLTRYHQVPANRHGYQQIPGEQNMEGEQKPPLKYLLTNLELLGFLMQLASLVVIPVLLSENQLLMKTKHYTVATYILIPVSLFIISAVWSGWIQKWVIKSSTADSARLKAGKFIITIIIKHVHFANNYGACI